MVLIKRLTRENYNERDSPLGNILVVQTGRNCRGELGVVVKDGALLKIIFQSEEYGEGGHYSATTVLGLMDRTFGWTEFYYIEIKP